MGFGVEMDRRAFLVSGVFGVAALTPANAAVDPTDVQLRGTMDPAPAELRPGISLDQGPILQRMLDQAFVEDRPLQLPAGRFVVSGVRLPPRTRLLGVAGATRLVLGETGSLITADTGETIVLRDLVLEARDGWLDTHVPGLVHLANCESVAIETCELIGSPASGIVLERSAGRVRDTRVLQAKAAGIRAVEATGLSILDNTIEDCGSGGIQVWRWRDGEDGTIVSGNRISRVSAADTGPGETGHGISVFRSHGVLVANNSVSDCVHSAVRVNASHDIRVLGNSCRRTGAEAISTAYGCAGAMVANNVGAAELRGAM
jgi:uncharacterized secreted repeat protein (TIGR03808 family)